MFAAFTEVRHLSRWWGPEGFSTSTRSFSWSVGGAWDFVMHGPDGTEYPEWITWTEISPPERIALLHGESRDAPDAFESVLTFAAVGEGTRIEMHTVFFSVSMSLDGFIAPGSADELMGKQWMELQARIFATRFFATRFFRENLGSARGRGGEGARRRPSTRRSTS